MSIKILIVGAGEVGFTLAKYLSNEDYDITVIDTRSNKAIISIPVGRVPYGILIDDK